VRIAFVTDSPYYLDRRAQRSVSVLLELGNQVTVLDQGINPELSAGAIPVSADLHSSPIPRSRTRRLLWSLRNRIAPLMAHRGRTLWCFDQLEQIKPDLIHVVNPFSLEAVTDFCAEYDVPFIYEAYEYWSEHLSSHEYGLANRLASYLRDVEFQAIQKSDYVISVSPLICNWYQELGAKKVICIYNTPDYNIWNNSTSECMQRAAELPPQLQLVHSGNLAHNRRVDILIKAVAKVQNSSLLILGSGPEEKHLKKLVNFLSIEERVFFQPPVTSAELISRLKDFDIGLITHFPDSKQLDGALPNKLFDYLAAGLGIVAFRTKALGSLEDVESFAILLDEASEIALAEALQSLSNDPERVSQMKRVACYVMHRYSSEQAREKLAEIYRSF